MSNPASPFSRRQVLIGGGAVAAGLALPAGQASAAPLTGWARDTWRSMVAMTDPRTGLVADNIPGNLEGRSAYTSPTNIGGYLWSTLVARDLRLITPDESARRIRQTLRTLQRMEHHEASGMYYNWYDPADGSVIHKWPDNGNVVVPFVSSVDAAWLGAALLCIRNGDPANSKVAGKMFAKMRFDAFADPSFKYLSYGGFYVEDPAPLGRPETDFVKRDLIGEGRTVWYTANHHYDTVVSETRITTYLGIAKRQIPGTAYYSSWRTFPPDWTWPEMEPVGEWREYLGVRVFEGAHHYYGRNTVPGWGGSMFEELMPNVFVPEEDWAPRSWGKNHRNHVAVQRLHGMEEYGYWGFSPASEPYGGYAEWGVDALGLRPDGYFSDREHTDYDEGFPSVGRPAVNPDPDYGDGVVTPHASFLAMMHEPRQATANLKRISRDFDAYGPGGFYDAVATQSKKVAKRYLSLDQAMIMGALGNVLCDDNLRRYFTRGEVTRYVRPVIAPEVFGPDN